MRIYGVVIEEHALAGMFLFFDKNDMI